MYNQVNISSGHSINCQGASDIIANGDFSDTSTPNWVSSDITKLGPVTSNSK